ncbi:hypothetical protein [Tardiphaga sp.]|uniref:hypothetical protein n=1 Tax=Tardiphaga sp. TaxID=1926292 RepID=UPI00352A65F4
MDSFSQVKALPLALAVEKAPDCGRRIGREALVGEDGRWALPLMATESATAETPMPTAEAPSAKAKADARTSITIAATINRATVTIPAATIIGLRSIVRAPRSIAIALVIWTSIAARMRVTSMT